MLYAYIIFNVSDLFQSWLFELKLNFNSIKQRRSDVFGPDHINYSIPNSGLETDRNAVHANKKIAPFPFTKQFLRTNVCMRILKKFMRSGSENCSFWEHWPNYKVASLCEKQRELNMITYSLSHHTRLLQWLQ